MTRTRELTFFFFFFFTWLFSSVSSHLCYLSFMSTSERQYTKYDLDRNRERETAHTPEPLSRAGLLLTALLLLFFLSFFLSFFFFGCFSNMQNQANCLSVNIICDFSCTYTFYVLSDWVNRDSKQKPAVEWFPQKKRERERNELGPSLMLHIGPTSHHHRPISRPPGAHKLLPDTMNISWWHSAQWKAPFHPSKHFK